MSKRQVVLIMTDTQGTNILGCYGNKDMKTPNIDALAQEGTMFNRAYTCQPVCGPARSAIYTGLFPHSNGSWGNTMPLSDDVLTVGQLLSQKGIKTAHIGKWHLDGGDYFGKGVCPDGWDSEYWYDMRTYLEEFDDEFRVRSRKSGEPLDETDTYGNGVSNRAIHFLNKYTDTDFFLSVSYDEPHHPWLCPEPYFSMYENYVTPPKENWDDDLSNKPDYQRVWGGRDITKKKTHTRAHSLYYGCNSYVDYEIGRVLEAVKKHAPDALIIFTSDHGDFINSHNLTGKGPAFYDEITRIPLIIKKPGTIKEGQVIEAPASHIDITPTILDAYGIKTPVMMEGRSMLEMLEGKAKMNQVVFTEFSRYEIDHDGFGGFQPLRAATDGRYKLSINLMSQDELYDIEKDPQEMNNLINSTDHEAIRNHLHDLILNWQDKTRDPFRGYYWMVRPWRKDEKAPTWRNSGYTRQKENEEGMPRELDYETGLEMVNAVRIK